MVEQNYPNLEYSVLDAGSTDRTIEILQKYAAQLNFWRSEADEGQAAAINEGFQRASGDILRTAGNCAPAFFASCRQPLRVPFAK